MKREDILKEAKDLISGARAKNYGDAHVNHDRIAKMWSVLLNKDITVSEVYMCMVAVKLSRLCQTQDHKDSWIDICGYGALGGENNEKTK